MFNQELKIVSRTGKLYTSSFPIYRMISDFSFMQKVEIPDDRIKIVASDYDTCTLEIQGGGKFILRIIEREPNSMVKIAVDANSPFEFTMWIQLKELQAYDTRLRITLHATLNPFLKLVLQKHFENFVETMVDRLEKFFSPDRPYYNTNYEA